MANTLTNLIPVMYKGMDIARRELVGLIPAVDIDAAAAAAAVNQTIRTPIIPVATTGNVTPGQQPPDDGDQTRHVPRMTRGKTVRKSKGGRSERAQRQFMKWR